MKKIITLIFLLISWVAQAQIPSSPNCPPNIGNSFLHISGPSHKSCNQPISLNAIAINPPMSTDSYSVSTIPYSPYPWVGANQITSILTIDDTWSGVLPLPFNFCFYGTQYNQFLVSSNGDLTFDISHPTSFCPYANQSWVLPQASSSSPTTNAINNGIFLNFDYYPPGGSNTTTNHKNITWDVYGSAPCRALVVSWDSIPLFSCNDSLVSQQIVCYENTNIVDMFIKQKSSCAAWQNGVAQQGMQNTGGTKATWVPGRNGTVFSAYYDGKRFSPAGPFTYTWYVLGNSTPIGTGATLSVNPLVNTCYTVKATSACSNLVLLDTFCVTIDTPTIAKFGSKVHLGCVHDTIVFHDSSLNALNYVWNFGDGTGSIQQNPTHVYQTQNIFTVTLIARNLTGCSDTIKKTFDLRHPIKAQMVSIPLNDSLCLGTIYKLTNFSITNPIVSTFNFGDGTVFNMNTVKDTTHLYTHAGTYHFILSIKDTLGCVDTVKRSIYVEPTPYVNFTVSDSVICLGEPIFFYDSVAALTVKYIWDFGDGTIMTNVHAPIHTYTQSGQQILVSLTGKYLVCKDSVFNKKIDVYDNPIVTLRSDTSMCEGLGSSIPLVIGSITGANSYLWNDGDINPTKSALKPDYYWVKATNTIAGCSSSDSVWIKRDCYLNIANSFTPDGDGLNDYFMPRELISSGVASFYLSIFNRWGEEVFRTSNIDGRGWDGKYGLKDQPMGTYIYTIKVVFINGESKTFTGNVTLLR